MSTNQEAEKKPGDSKKYRKGYIKKQPYKCPLCRKLFSSLGQLKEHANLHISEQAYKSDRCCHSSSQMAKDIQFQSGEQLHTCQECQKPINQVTKLKAHEIHTSKSLYKCPKCKKLLKKSVDLKEHIQTHKHEKCYKCHYCSKSFSSSNHLKRHGLSHSRDSYKCPLCRKPFTRLNSVKEHIIKIHAGDPSFKHFHQNKPRNQLKLSKECKTINRGMLEDKNPQGRKPLKWWTWLKEHLLKQR